MVLHHVAKRSGLFVVGRAALDAEALRDRDLHLSDSLAAPERLDEHVRESEHEEVLDRLLAEVVVDAVDLLLLEVPPGDAIQLLGGGEVPAERLLDDDPGPPRARVEARGPEARERRAERLEGQGQVEDAVALQAVLLLERLDPTSQGGEARG